MHKSLYVNPQTRLVSTKPNCPNNSASSFKLQMEEFGKDTLPQIAAEVFPKSSLTV